jgi:glycosyltransferase involved in cell wall biosynthesis
LHVIYAGTLSVRKGIADLLAGFAAADLADARLSLLGGETPELAKLLDQQPSAVQRLGHRPQSELVQYYSQAHCFAMASIEEGMAYVQIQALASGLPLICTPNTGGEDLLRLGGATGLDDGNGILEFPAGWMVPIHAPQAIAHCLRRLAKEPGLWEAKRQAALALAGSSLSWSAYGQRAISHYRRLLAAAQNAGQEPDPTEHSQASQAYWPPATSG